MNLQSKFYNNAKIIKGLNRVTLTSTKYIVLFLAKVIKKVIILNKIDPELKPKSLYDDLYTYFNQSYDKDAYDADFDVKKYSSVAFSKVKEKMPSLENEDYLFATNLSSYNDTAESELPDFLDILYDTIKDKKEALDLDKKYIDDEKFIVTESSLKEALNPLKRRSSAKKGKLYQRVDR
jgi:hypothetical protein